MGFNVSYRYALKDKFSSVATKINSKFASLQSKAESLKNTVNKLSKKFTSLGKGLSLKLSAPLLAIGGLSLKSAADIETMEVAFASMTGSADKAKEVVKGLIDFAAKTPFQLLGIGKAAKQLLAVGVSTGELQSKLKFLGDISAGANVPLSDMAAIFGKAKSKGKAMTEELLQLSDRGIPIISVLAKKLGVSKNAVFELASKSKISFGILESALVSMTKKGGIFEDQMQKQSATLAGAFSTLKDNVNLSLAALGNQIIETFDLKNTINTVIGVIQRATAAFINFTKENPRLAKLGVIIAGIGIVIGPLLIAVGAIAAAFTVLSVPILIITGALAGIGLAIAGLIAFWKDLKQAMQNVVDFWGTVFTSAINSVTSKVKSLISSVPFLGKLFEGGADININSAGVAAQTITNNSRLEGQINVNAPAGVVSSVQSKVTGSPNANLGLNMAGAR